MISTNQEETYSLKAAFERCSAIFEVKINRYNADNEIFAEQLSISEIEDFNQTITFFWVGYNRHNAMVEKQIKTITLGARTFILHAIR